MVIELATKLDIWEMNNSVTGTDIMRKSTVEESDKYIVEVDGYLSNYYTRLMGKGTRRSKILHGIDTDFSDDREFTAELLWFWASIFHTVDRIDSRNTISETRLLEFFAVSEPQPLNAVVERFDSQPLYVEPLLDSRCAGGLLTEDEDGRYSITEHGKERLIELRPNFVFD